MWGWACFSSNYCSPGASQCDWHNTLDISPELDSHQRGDLIKTSASKPLHSSLEAKENINRRFNE